MPNPIYKGRPQVTGQSIISHAMPTNVVLTPESRRLVIQMRRLRDEEDDLERQRLRLMERQATVVVGLREQGVQRSKIAMLLNVPSSRVDLLLRVAEAVDSNG